ncbi:DUF3108 domain-containing protein [Colwellia sp. 1_MG-2023]|uniref:DUF3108 domain-containing protein n=1 Tax=Colwellia sp. 1_MG-2023 TaxID=3062649 RepID=UPI0026E23FF8|nr:DUF3108 domain-containing protein [Colwellia sp. 1_MG-2023]MDO6446186.1 DUF3108 domain-containing protein [Colwellia sp. 1_MG-2023]
MLKAVCYFCLSTLTFTLLASPNVSASDNEQSSANIVVKPFSAEYTILHKSSPVGTGVRELKNLDNGLIEYSYHTDIEWLIFSDARKETSTVVLKDNQVIPTLYHYERSGTGRDKEYQWRYDTKNNKAFDMKKEREKTINFPINIQDKLSYHLQNRINLLQNPDQKHFVYPVISTSGTIKNYVYQYEGEEDIMLPYGLVKTIKLKREVVEKNRITYAWFAPELDYLMVKLYQAKSGVEQFEAQLNKLSINGQPVTK